MSYKLGANNVVQIIDSGATLPCRFVNGAIEATDWHSPFVLEFAKWVAAGNTPAAADPVVPPAVPGRDRERDLEKLQRAIADGDQGIANELVLKVLKESKP